MSRTTEFLSSQLAPKLMCYGSLDKLCSVQKKLQFSDMTNIQIRITFGRIVISALSSYLSDAKHMS